MPSTKTITIRSAYSAHDPKKYGTSIEGPSLTKQSFREECNINNIMAKYEKTQIVTHVRENAPYFGDFTDLPDFQTAMNIVAEANEMFASLPAKLRKRFSNDPGEYLEFCENPENEDEMRSLGLLPPAQTSDQGAGGASPGAAPPTPEESSDAPEPSETDGKPSK